MISITIYYTFRGMDVTSSNFGSVRTFIEHQLLLKVSYIGYDVEFTGLRFEKFERDHINSLPYEKYKKLKYVAETYQILQLGLSFVVYDEHDKRMKVFPYNFYLFPRSPIGYDRNLGMQLSCIKFNNENGMDWNKWIGQGINYVKLSEMAILEEEEKKCNIQDVLKNQLGQNAQICDNFIIACTELSTQTQQTQREFPLTGNHSLLKNIQTLFICLLKQNDLNLGLKTTENGVLIYKVDPKAKQQYLLKLHQEKFGFGLLFDKIWSKPTTFVGHNCNLDMLYIYHHLIAPLPQTYFAYKQSLQKAAHTFYDTKYIAYRYPSIAEMGSRLEDLIKCLRKQKQKESVLFLEGEFERYSLDKQALHQAGYDSYLTAWVFQQAMVRFDDLDKTCKNKININLSFFFMDVGNLTDQTNPEYANNILRINILVDEEEDVRLKRQEVVKIVRQGLSQFQGQYIIHEGYRQIFLEMKANRQLILKRLLKMIKNYEIKEVGTFSAYFDWQRMRVIKSERQAARIKERNAEDNASQSEKPKKSESSSPSKTGEQKQQQKQGEPKPYKKHIDFKKKK